MQKLIIGTISGLLAGLSIGLLMAPASGTETRANISNKAGKVKGKIKTAFGASKTELDELKNVFANQIEGLEEDVREKVLKLIDASKASYTHITNVAAN